MPSAQVAVFAADWFIYTVIFVVLLGLLLALTASSPRLGNHPLFPHSPREQRLSQCVIDLV